MIGYVKHFDSNKTISFKVIDNKLLKRILKYGKEFNEYLMNIECSLMNIEFDSEPDYGDNDK